MELKFYLNKFVKIDGIENYTLKALSAIKSCYDEYLEKTEGSDPDFPMVSFGGGDSGGKRVKGKNAATLDITENDDL